MQFLRHQPDQRAGRAVIGDDVVAVDGHLALGRHQDAADDADQRGLAGAVGAEQREDLAAMDIKIDALKRLKPGRVASSKGSVTEMIDCMARNLRRVAAAI